MNKNLLQILENDFYVQLTTDFILYRFVDIFRYIFFTIFILTPTSYVEKLKSKKKKLFKKICKIARKCIFYFFSPRNMKYKKYKFLFNIILTFAMPDNFFKTNIFFEFFTFWFCFVYFFHFFTQYFQ